MASALNNRKRVDMPLKQRNQYTSGLKYTGTNGLLLTSEFASSTQGERQFLNVFRNCTLLTTPQNSAHLVVQSQFLNTMVGLNFSPSWPEHNINCLPQWQITQLSAYMAQSQLPTDSFSKSSNPQDHRFRAWCHSHSSPISYQGFIMTIVIVISFARERRLYQM